MRSLPNSPAAMLVAFLAIAGLVLPRATAASSMQSPAEGATHTSVPPPTLTNKEVLEMLKAGMPA